MESLNSLYMKKLQKLVFFGNERLATGLNHTDTPTLRALIKEGYQIVAVVANHTPGRSRNARKLEIAEVAEAHNIPLFLPKKTAEIKEELQNLDAEAAVLVAYGKIIPQKIIDLFPKGIVNIHPSLLPKYRGPTPIEQSILDGVTVTGVSLMRLEAKMDAGPLYAQAQYRLERHETKEELATQLLHLGKDMLIDQLPSILDGSAELYPQEDSRATYCHLLSKDDGTVNPSIETAQEIERAVRAYAGYPKTCTTIEGHKAILLSVQPVSSKIPGELIIECHNDTLLQIEELIAPSGRKMSGADFARGYLK